MNLFELATEFRRQYDNFHFHQKAYLKAKAEKDKLLNKINDKLKAQLEPDIKYSGIGAFYFNKELQHTTFVPETIREANS